MTDNRCDDVWNGKRCCLPAGHDEYHDNTGQSIEDRDPDGECFRGGEAAAYHAEEQARIQRELK